MIRKFTEFILYSHIFIGLGAFALNYVCQIFLLGEWNDPLLSLFCFGACWFSYLFHRFNVFQKRDSAKDNEVMLWTKKHLLVLKSIFPILGLGLLYQFFQFNLQSQFLLGLVGFISFTYSSSFFGFSLRDIPFLKIFLISFNWAACTTLLVACEYNASIDSTILAGLHSFLLIFALTIPFDIRDLAYDRRDELKTIPNKLKPTQTLAIAMVIMAFWTLTIVPLSGKSLPWLMVSVLIFLPLYYLLIDRTGQKRSELYYLGLVDGYIILWGLAVYILRIFL